MSNRYGREGIANMQQTLMLMAQILECYSGFSSSSSSSSIHTFGDNGTFSRFEYSINVLFVEQILRHSSCRSNIQLVTSWSFCSISRGGQTAWTDLYPSTNLADWIHKMYNIYCMRSPYFVPVGNFALIIYSNLYGFFVNVVIFCFSTFKVNSPQT